MARDLAFRLAQAQSRNRLPSLSAAVARESDELLAVRLGTSPEPAADTQYRIGSITKTFTAVLVLQLRDAGLLRLDDPVGEHVPGTPLGGLSIRDLLAHIAGLRREPIGDFWEASPGRTWEQLRAGLDAGDARLPSRRVHHYSNLGYALLGQAVERLRGMPWAGALTRHVLAPLELHDTSWAPREPYAVGLRVHPFADNVTPEPLHDTLAMGPAGQLWSTPGDVCRWGRFLADPVEDVLAPGTVEEMCHPVVLEDLDAWTRGYGLGLQLFRRGDRVLVGHGGSMPGFIAGLAVHRGAKVSAAVCTNAWWATSGAGLACDLVVGVLDGDPVPPATWVPTDVPEELAELLGTWWWRGVQLVAFVADGALHLVPAGESREDADRYEPIAPDLFVGVSGGDRGEHLRVLRDAQGRARSLDLATYVLTREPDEPGGP